MIPKHSALVVAGRSADAPGLLEALRIRYGGSATSFTLLVPAVPRGLAWATDMSAGWPEAMRRAGRAADAMRAAGLVVEETIVGDPDPYAAVGDALHCRRFDELIVVTLPSGVSSWLAVGLPGRLRRLTEVPISRLTIDRPGRAATSARQLAAALA
jgi:hypothetical protein